jgi:inosine/xanthosine triphosphatase
MAPSLVRSLAGGVVRVGTLNPAKLAAVRGALGAHAADPDILSIQGVDVPSGVPDQPVGWEEIIAGARNRARAALAAGGAELGIGIEDGLVELPVGGTGAAGVGSTGSAVEGGPGIFNVGCAWVTDGRREGSGFSAGFAYPSGCREPAFHERRPIGDLFDALWQAKRGTAEPAAASGRLGGNIGQLTQGRLERSAYGGQAILCALVPFLHVDLYD